MEKIVFHSKYDPSPIINRDKVFDVHDNVDRLSYVDNTAMVKRFIMEGKSLAMARAQALRSGSYSGDLKEIDSDTGVPIPVYSMDAVIADSMIKSASSRFETPAVSERDATINDATRTEHSGVNAPSTDVE